MRKELKNKGQVMILSVLLISSAILAASSLAGLLVLFQLKRTAGAEDSARAVFAADAGIENALYKRFVDGCTEGDLLKDKFDFSNGQSANYQVKMDSCDYTVSVGSSKNTARAFEISFEGLCSFGGQMQNEEACAPEPPPAP
ncbi:MAG: hypothetical protein COT89_01480 [Candidatus Colwellbacteria bacterium CG10_big_fil_rev_8_21_14_0_10_42_22]|uniref:Type 4 fimbrial biogenesis protein PilX N-terminal domain-containing protein n=1 Tax=Candidatus Colwellbacteria bacterium CG10_big_fil_rev_8_21_14_0_10_42_22 TaxID=1974540 RepID=A0A2H0VG85_9BACT|nr:MAG: hypothetical protein COT89_01480 [Candidatus Colwellbacteria bacterium CG10_big_fil_rev_8_21_14_0_10_42_22]